MTPSDDDWKARFDKLTEVPFTNDLRARIRDQAVAALSEPRVDRGRRTGSRIRRWMAAAGAAAAVIVLGLGIWNLAGPASPRGLQNGHNELARTNERTTIMAGVRAYGLKRSALRVDTVWTGVPRGQHSPTVFAKLTNTGPGVISSENALGVLVFASTVTTNWLRGGQSFTFVNAPQRGVRPGQTVVWKFQPIGVPTDAQGQPSGHPVLVFYATGLVPIGQADDVWHVPPITVRDVVLQPREHWTGGQSVGLSALLVNGSKQPVLLRDLLAVIWFSKTQNGDFTQPTSVRFFDTIQPTTGTASVLGAGQSLPVYFRNIGSANADFLGMAPHIAIVHR